MSLEDDILIENFLRNQLSEEDKVLFLEKTKKDLDFKEKFLLEKELFETLNEETWSQGNHNPKDIEDYKELFKSQESKDLESVINKVNKDYHKPKNNLLKWFISSAAIILVFFMINKLIPKTHTSEELYTSYLSKSELPSLIVRSGGNSNLELAQQLFEEEKYIEALEIFNKELKNPEILNGNMFLYTGISQMELNRYTEAEQTFDRLISSDLIDSPKGKWYKALLYLKQNKITSSKVLLKEIISSSSFNNQKAKELLSKLK